MKHSLTLTLVLSTLAAPALAGGLSPAQQLGKSLYFDPQLSLNGNLPCAGCHDPDAGFSSPSEAANAHGVAVEGSVAGRFGNRKPPSAAYASPAPVFHHTMEDGDVLFVGGAFVDGRASGHQLGNPAADQAMGPFLNPLEMAMPHQACVVQRACEGASGEAMQAVWGAQICDISFPAGLAEQCGQADASISIDDEQMAAKIDTAYHAIAYAIADYESSSEVNSFSSRYDKWKAGQGALSEAELSGLKVFEGKGHCSACHVLDPGPHGEPALFTDYTYDNLGVPRNPENPFYQQAVNADGADYVDPGLAAFLATDAVYDVFASGARGKFKVPTLRNVDKRPSADATKSYMHNGYFKTLAGVVKFYNTRDVWPACESDLVSEAEALAAKCWPAAEVPETVNHDELGNLGLTDGEEADLVAFLKTLSDE